MSAADWWRVGFASDFARNIARIADSLEKIAAVLTAIAKLLETKGEDDGYPW